MIGTDGCKFIFSGRLSCLGEWMSLQVVFMVVFYLPPPEDNNYYLDIGRREKLFGSRGEHASTPVAIKMIPCWCLRDRIGDLWLRFVFGFVLTFSKPWDCAAALLHWTVAQQFHSGSWMKFVSDVGIQIYLWGNMDACCKKCDLQSLWCKQGSHGGRIIFLSTDSPSLPDLMQHWIYPVNLQGPKARKCLICV